jgi:hypothetical protein
VAADIEALRAQVAQAVTHQLSLYADHLALVVGNNPQGSVTDILARPDVQQSLAVSLEAGKSQAMAAVQHAWADAGGQLTDPAYHHLVLDVTRAYNQAPTEISHSVVQAFHSVPPPAPFVPGQDQPGTNPQMHAAVRRAVAVRDAVNGQAQSLALRNGLSVDVAGSHGATSALLAEAMGRPDAARLGKRWVASMNGMDPKSCAWCRKLHGTVIPLGDQFDHGAPIPGKYKPIQPPKVWRGVLAGPPRHPNCRCRLEIVPLPGAEPVPVPSPAAQVPEEELVSSDEIADLPEERYVSFREFLSAALHELGQVIRAILGIGGGGG